MSQFTKNLELDSTLASGLQVPEGRKYSTHFDQRRTIDASGVVVDTANSLTYIADGLYNISDYYPLTLNATGILQVDIRDQRGIGEVAILDSAGATVLTAKPSKFSARDSATTSTTVNSSGAHYAYIQIKGRSGTQYRLGIQVTDP